MKKTSKQFNEKKFQKRLMKFMIETNLSHKIVQRSSFHQLIQYLRSKTKIFDRTKFVKFIRLRVKKTQQNVLKNLKFKIKMFIVCDVWNSSNKCVFLKITAYFINKNWRYRKILFAFKFLQNKHDENKLTKIVLQIFLTHKLKNRLMMMTIDNVFNNRILRRQLTKKLRDRNIDWNDEKKIVNCMTHVLQLIVMTILTDLNVQARNENLAFKFDVENFKKINKMFFFENTVRKINFDDLKLIHLLTSIKIH